jgi:2-amino-4-hydroxy-6-hydroxymethyldihydropteridine diphosphokinase
LSEATFQLAAVSLGANLGDAHAQLNEALRWLDALPQTRLAAQSAFYETEPVDKPDQPWFINAVALLETRLEPEALLAALLALELRAGRTRTVDKGPRVLDLDLLLFGESKVESATLTLPHPRMHLRRFVLEPLCEIAPQMRHPVLDACVAELLDRCEDDAVVRRFDPTRS